MEDKNEAKVIKKDKNKNNNKREINKPNKSSENKNFDKGFVGKRKAIRRHPNPSALQKKNTSLNSILNFFNSNKENKIVIEQKNYSLIEMNEIEKRLMNCFNYLMSHYNDSNEIIDTTETETEIEKEKEKMTITIDEQTSFEILGLKPFTINLNYHNKYFKEILYKTSRKIRFVDDSKRKIYEKFIYNIDNLTNVLEELGFKSFYTKINKNTNEENKETNSLNTEISLGEPSIIFSDKTINEIYKDCTKITLREENYNNRFKYPIIILEDLNNNCKEYYAENSNNKYIDLKEYENASYNFFNFKDFRQTKIMYFYGPKNCSKTTFLFCIINKFQYSKTRTLYFNYNYLRDKNFIATKKAIYKEILYFCSDIKEMKEIENFKVFNEITNNKNIMEIIYKLLINLFKVIEEEKNIYKRIIIIDNINNLEEDDEAFTYLNKIKNLISEKNYNYKLIICGRGKYFNKLFIDSYKNLQIITNDIVDNYVMNEYIYLFSTNLNENINNINENLILNEIKEINTYNFFSLFFAEELHNKNLSYHNVADKNNLLSIMPLEYFKIIINVGEEADRIDNDEEEKNKGVYFVFYNKLYKEVIRRKIEVRVEKGILIRLLKEKEYPRTVFGVCFEKLITLLLKNNQLTYLNLKFDKNNIKEVEEISNFKEENNNYKSIFNNMDKEKPILITQINYFGKFYDLLIIIKHNNLFYSNFIQISVDKTERDIDIILNDLKGNEISYHKNICDELGIDRNLNKISLIFIFDLETQKINNFSSGVKFCKKKKVDCYLFSSKECKFFSYNDYTKTTTYTTNIFPFFTTINYENITQKGKDTRIDQYFKKDN